jgi:hypothetical protein
VKHVTHGSGCAAKSDGFMLEVLGKTIHGRTSALKSFTEKGGSSASFSCRFDFDEVAPRCVNRSQMKIRLFLSMRAPLIAENLFLGNSLPYSRSAR